MIKNTNLNQGPADFAEAGLMTGHIISTSPFDLHNAGGTSEQLMLQTTSSPSPKRAQTARGTEPTQQSPVELARTARGMVEAVRNGGQVINISTH